MLYNVLSTVAYGVLLLAEALTLFLIALRLRGAELLYGWQSLVVLQVIGVVGMWLTASEFSVTVTTIMLVVTLLAIFYQLSRLRRFAHGGSRVGHDPESIKLVWSRKRFNTKPFWPHAVLGGFIAIAPIFMF